MRGGPREEGENHKKRAGRLRVYVIKKSHAPCTRREQKVI